jgi:hypothetical protein
MRVIAHTEAAARQMLHDRVKQGIMTENDANRLFRYAFPTVLATLGNWRRKEIKDAAIEAAIDRRIRAARLRISYATKQNDRNLAQRDLVVAQMFSAVWHGMQEDVQTYSGR